MKKTLIGLLFFSLLVLSGCGQKASNNLNQTVDTPEDILATSTSNEPISLDSIAPDGSIIPKTTDTCQDNKGTWLNDYRECENVGSDWCERHGGVFNECGSACRHQAKETVCTLQCVPFCSLANDGSDHQTLINISNDSACGICPTYAAPKTGWCQDGVIVPAQKDSCGCVGRPTCNK